MSDAKAPPRGPAVALMEFSSIAWGIVAGDAIVKAAPVGSIYAGTVHPGKYLVLVGGDTASVEEALAAGTSAGGSAVVDSMFLPDVHPDVISALRSSAASAAFTGEALGILETSTVAAVLDATDAGVKAARVDLIAVRLADGLGGKGYALFSGALAEVDAAVSAAVARVEPVGALLEHRVIAQLHAEMAENLLADLQFMALVRSSDDEGGG